ncbi:polar amino acid transport system substrate-binding protein [Streptomyces sp. Amel2xB2]|uniref:ABC transporter substrate-binding protein n=1 Tax=Streptomyces sp. Amel2xB2 TaxID=1305829 RepID=UPI000DBA419B|nr:ABC transporter substrate-binding protein [Streptomyces sp. Amel2xB2]RAJ71408.1 polar amino acid transport system substrate-binding protein [Streptomyces sp. Amel2xB2]
MTARFLCRTAAARSRRSSRASGPRGASGIAAPLAVAVAGALLLSGCGDQTDSAAGGADTQGSKAPLFDKLPKKIQKAGVVKVGTDAAYKPMEYKDGQEIVGLDPDLANALGKQLGVRFEFTNGVFDGLITSMQTGRFDMIMSSMTDTKDRQQGLDDKGKKVGKGVDFVDYLTAGSSILVKKGNPEKITSVDQLCGEKVATQRGTTSHEILKKQIDKCKKNRERPITIEPFDNDDEARVRLKAGGVVADISDFPVAANAAKSGDDFEVVGDQMESAPYGMAVAKGNDEMSGALKEALAKIIKDGSYEKALKKWGVEDGGVSEAKINSGS